MADQKNIAELEKLWDNYEHRPVKGDKYLHYKGGEYVIVDTGYLEASETPCVVYHSLLKKTTWVRTAENFLEDVEVDGRTMPRFKKLV